MRLLVLWNLGYIQVRRKTIVGQVQRYYSTINSYMGCMVDKIQKRDKLKDRLLTKFISSKKR